MSLAVRKELKMHLRSLQHDDAQLPNACEEQAAPPVTHTNLGSWVVAAAQTTSGNIQKGGSTWRLEKTLAQRRDDPR